MSDSDTYLDNILEGVTVADASASAPEQSPSADQRADAQAEAERASAPAKDQEVSDAPEEATPALTGLDALLEGLPPLSASNAPPSPASGSKPDDADDRQSETIANVSAGAAGNDQTGGPRVESLNLDTDVSAQAAALPVAAPHDILGLPGQPDIAALSLIHI